MPKSAIAEVPSPGTASRLKSVNVSRRGNALLKNVSEIEAVPSEPRVTAVTGSATALSPIWTISAATGRRTAKPSAGTPLPGPSFSSVLASLVAAAWTRTDDVALLVPDWSSRRNGGPGGAGGAGSTVQAKLVKATA